MKNQRDNAFDARSTPPMSKLDDPIATSASFHNLIRKQCVSLETLSHELTRLRADNVARYRAAMIVRFFDLDAREHHDDEELIFFPRLLALDIDTAAKTELGAMLNILSKDHRALHEVWKPLRQSLLNIVDAKSGWVDVDVTTFVTLCRHHLHKEDSSVLPFARRHLSDEALQELRGAIVTRRSEIEH